MPDKKERAKDSYREEESAADTDMCKASTKKTWKYQIACKGAGGLVTR